MDQRTVAIIATPLVSHRYPHPAPSAQQKQHDARNWDRRYASAAVVKLALFICPVRIGTVKQHVDVHVNCNATCAIVIASVWVYKEVTR